MITGRIRFWYARAVCFIRKWLTPFVFFSCLLVIVNDRRLLGLHALVRPFRPVSTAHLVFIIEQGTGGLPPSPYCSHHLVLRRRVGSSRTSPCGDASLTIILAGILGTSSFFSNPQCGKSADQFPGTEAHTLTRTFFYVLRTICVRTFYPRLIGAKKLTSLKPIGTNRDRRESCQL
jgi:hypothetical protein